MRNTKLGGRPRRRLRSSETLNHQTIISIKAHSRGIGKHSHLYFIFMELAGRRRALEIRALDRCTKR